MQMSTDENNTWEDFITSRAQLLVHVQLQQASDSKESQILESCKSEFARLADFQVASIRVLLDSKKLTYPDSRRIEVLVHLLKL